MIEYIPKWAEDIYYAQEEIPSLKKTIGWKEFVETDYITDDCMTSQLVAEWLGL